MSENEEPTPDVDPENPEPKPQEGVEDPEDPEDDPNGFDAEKAREKLRKINSENRNLRERAKKAEEAAKQNAGSGEKVTALEAENLRLRVAVKHGLPENLAKRLTGNTEEELLADAEELLDLMGGKKPPTQQPKERLRGGGDPNRPVDDLLDEEKFLDKVFRN